MAWKPGQTVVLTIEADKSVDLSVARIEGKLTGVLGHSVRVRNEVTGEVSEESVIKNTRCADCGSLDGQRYAAWRWGDGIGAASPPYCERCWPKHRDHYQPKKEEGR